MNVAKSLGDPPRILPPRPSSLNFISGFSSPAMISLLSVSTQYFSDGHSGLMFAARMTFAHFSVSVTRCRPNSPGVSNIGAVPTSVLSFSILGSFNPALISRVSLSMIAGGVPAGTPTPNNSAHSNPAIVSETVGTSGNVWERFAVVTANARVEPARIC